MRSVNPATGEVVKEYKEMSPQEAAAIIDNAHEAFLSWRETSFTDRATFMRKAAKTLEGRKEAYARLIAEEMGKPRSQGVAEIEKSAWICKYYAEHANAFLSAETAETDAAKSYVRFDPLGVVLAVMPWNFPFWQVFRFAAPGLMAGNVGVLKHASNVPGCALAIEDVFREAGFPEGAFRTLLIGSKGVEAVIRHPRVRAVTLTGSTPAGKAVAKASGSVLKKTVLELGGSDPYIVLEDADIALAAETCAASRMNNAGQSCIAAKRFVVHSSIAKPFTEALAERMGRHAMGDPLKEGTTLGPLAREDLRDALHRQVEESVAAGATVVTGGAIPDTDGAYYPPTVLSGVEKGMPAYDEELFGPVAAVIEARDEEHAITIANDTPFGLGAAIFSEDTDRAERLARRIDAGSVFINALVKSDPRLPFGGVKESGYGRELSVFGIREFVNVKTISVR